MRKSIQRGLLAVTTCLSTSVVASDLASRGNVGGMPVTTPNRSVYLNGVDVSSARNQDLRNVHIKISENGDIFISAPQYQVTEEETFMPLSSYTTKSAPPEHKSPQPIVDAANSKTPRTVERALNDRPTPASAIPEKTVTPAKNAPAQPASPAPRSGG